MTYLFSFFSHHRSIFFMFFALAAVAFVGGIDSPVHAQLFDASRDLPESLNQAGGGITFREAILRAINFVLGFVGILAVIMLIYAGFQYIYGGADAADGAKDTIIYAIVGIIVILFSFAIINTIFDVATGQDTGSGAV